MEFRILGPLEVWRGGASVRIGGPRQRALLALLLCHANRVVSRERLVEELMGEQRADSADRMLHVQVSRLRKAIASDDDEPRLLARPPGYLLRVEEGELDLHEFERRLADGRRALERDELRQGVAKLRAAESVWRGRPLADLEFERFARLEVPRLEELRLLAVEERIDAELALGEHAALCPELEALVQEHPLRERLRGQFMLALYRTGRQAEALATYRAGRSLLVEELGLEPSPQLRRLEQAILTHDRSLQLKPPAPPPATPAPPPPPPAFDGRGLPPPDEPPLSSAGPKTPRYRIPGGAVRALLLLAAAVAAIFVLTGGGDPRQQAPPNSLAAIDVRSDRVAAVVPVGLLPGPVAFGSGSVWVANAGDQTISRVDPTARRTVGTIPLGATPTGIAAGSGALWVVEAEPGSTSVVLRRIDPQFDALGPGRRLGNVVPGGPGSVAAQNGDVWVAPSSGLLARVDGRTGRVLKQLDPHASPAGIAVGDGAVWTTDSDANNVIRIDPTGLLTPIAVGNGPRAIATGDGGVWVADALDDAVVRVDPATAAVTSTIPVGRSPSAIAVGDGSVWVANAGDGTVSRIDPSTDRVMVTIDVGGSPQAITIAGARAWVSVDPVIGQGPAPTGGSLRMETLPDVDHLDPALAYAPGSWQLLYATCAKLLNYPDRSGAAGAELIPEVATSLPSRSANGKTYTFTIRPGFRFSPPSGQPVTAQTFKSTIERTLNPRMRSPVAYEFADVAGAPAYMAGRASHIAGIQARGDRLTVRLLTLDPAMPSKLAQPFFCAVPTNTPIDPQGIGTVPSAGPYYVASYIPNQSVVLARNPNYRGSRPHRLDRIALTLGTSSEKAVADIRAGRADYTTMGGTPASSVAGLASRLAMRYGPGSPAAQAHRQQYFESQLPELDFLLLNTHRPLFRNPRLRQAVNYAIGRRALARLGDGYGFADHPTSQYLPPGIPGSTDQEPYPLTADVARARVLSSGHRGTAVLYTCDYSACLQLAQLVTDDLATIGLHVRVKSFDHVALYARLARPHEPFDLAFATWSPDWPDPAAMLNGMLANGSFYPAFNDPRFNRASAAAGRLTGPQRDLVLGRLAFHLARDSAPIVAYGNAVSEELFSPRFGCQTHGFYYGVDLAALCLRRHPR